ncbi:uncharacterized protein LOC126719660 [Quercus robur]|uniref:uncharacterized protein LOC126719660 n=1 Tax=Quercus robur TaxID=38942 RepID=UPI0021639B33|nr:uncharacterized protein LOC126719660 [Quercus robur]
MDLKLTHHDVNWVYNLHHLKGQGYYLRSRYPKVKLIQCLPTSNKNLKEDFLIFSGEWHNGLPCPTVEGVPDKRYTKPNLRLVNKASLDKVLKAEIYVNEADGQLRAAHLILGYTPLSSAFQAPKYVIRARDPRLHRISVAYTGFIVLEGIPLPQYTSHTGPLFVAKPSAGVSSSQLTPREEEVEERKEEEKDKEEVVEVSETSDDFGIFDQSINSGEDPDEMGIQRKPQRSLLELMEGQPGKSAPVKSTQSQVPSLPARSPPPAPRQPSRQPPQPARPDAAELKRRREQKGKEVADIGKSRPTREDDTQRAAKQQKTRHQVTRGQERSDSQLSEPQAWLPAPMHSGEPLRDDASMRDFNSGIGCHVASAIEEALLLPKDMAEIKNMRKNELILDNKRYLSMIIQNTFKLNEMLNICSNQLDDERKRRTMAIQTLSKFEQDLADVKKKLHAEEQARKSAESALEGYQKQAEDQGNHLREANAELKKAQEQVLVLKKHSKETQKVRERAEKSREEAEKAKIEAERAMNEAEQRSYEVGIAESEEALKAEVPAMCRIYYVKTWDEALNRAGVEASSKLRKPENVFYPEAIRPSAFLPHQAETPPSVVNPNEEVLPCSFPLSGQPESAKGGIAPPGASSDKTATTSEAETAFQSFQQDLASTVLPTGGVTRDKEEITTSKANKSASQALKIQFKLKK